MTKFNAWNVFKNGLTGQKDWDRQWRDLSQKKNTKSLCWWWIAWSSNSLLFSKKS